MPVVGLTFPQALAQLQLGNHVSRAAWGGSPYLAIVIPIDFTTGKLLPYVYINTVPGAPWIPTPADLNATDWETVP